MRTFAVVPAAGRSARMGRPKLSLPVGGRAVIERVVAGLRDGGVDHVLVVVGPHVPELAPLAAAAGGEVLRLPAPTADMRATVEFGLARLEERYRPSSAEAWLLAPADHPALSAALVRDLIAAARTAGGSVVVPVCRGRRGHPVLIRWRHVGPLRAYTAGRGIDAFLRTIVAETTEWLVDNVDALADVDTPDDYRRATQPPGRFDESV